MQKGIISSWYAAIGGLAEPGDMFCTWTSKQSTTIYISEVSKFKKNLYRLMPKKAH